MCWDPPCQASTGTAHRGRARARGGAPVGRARHGEEFLHYQSRARNARRAPVAADPRTASYAGGTGPPRRRWPPHGRMPGQGLPAVRRASPTALGPGGPQRRRRAGRTQPGRRGQDPPSSTGARRASWRGSRILPAPQCRTAQDHAQGRAEGASHAMAHAPPLTVIFHGSPRRLSEGWPRPGRCLREQVMSD